VENSIEFARNVVEMEAAAVSHVKDLLGEAFDAATRRLVECKGRVVVSGIGKAGLIGDKMSATMASTGTPSFFLHPVDAIHGDLGRVTPDDIVILMSHSGESLEVLGLIDPIRSIGSTLMAITGRPDSTLGRNVDITLDCGEPPEACPLGLAPTASTAAMLALGDALAMTVLKLRDFSTRDYARFHPGGSLGRKLMRVEEVMRGGDRMTVVETGALTRDVLIAMNRTRGRPGAAIIRNGAGKLAGFFTDGDLARSLEGGSGFLERPIDEVMMDDPVTIGPERLASEALRLLRERKIDQLPVVDDERVPVGLLDVQDLLDARIVP
jgi:arabinose-5-phosphate isomerase